MATTQEDLLKALRGSSGREQVNFDLGQVALRPTIQQGGQYAVPVRETPRTNPALQLASALQDGSQLLSSFVDLQTKQGEIEAGALSPLEVQQRVEQGDPNATNFLDKLGKEKSFTENVYKRYFNSTVQPKLQTLQQELKSRPVHEYADMGITTPEDFQQYASGRVKELTDEFSQYTSKSPYAQALHNQLVETVVPDLVQKQVAMFDEGVTEFNKQEVITNRIPFNIENGVVLDPQASTQSGTQNTFREKPRGTIYGFEKKGDATFDTNSSFGIGANASEKEQAEIKAGKTNDAKLVANKDFALSPDLEEQARAAGFNLRDTMTMVMEDGSTHTGRWMDRTAKEFQGKTLSGRVDIYSPKGDSPVKDKIFVGFSRGEEDAMKSFETSVNDITNINIESFKNAKYSPSEAAKIAREDIVSQVKSLSTEGRFQEARKLQGVLERIKVGGQPLFGLADGKLQLAALEDAIDRDEEQEYAQNERLSKQKVDMEIAGVSLRLLNAPQEALEDEYSKVRSDINDRQGLTDSEKVLAIKELDQLYQNRAASEYTKATRSDAANAKLNAEGGSTDVFTNFRNSAASDDRIAGSIAGSPTLQEKAFIEDPLTGRKVINPAFSQQMRATLVSVGSQKSLLNEEQTEKIRRGESFTYDVNGKSIAFEGTTDLKQQKQLHLKLGQLFAEDLNSSLVKQLESDIAANPLFANAQGNTGKPMTPKELEYKRLVEAGVPPEQADEISTQAVIKASGNSGIIDSKGKVITARRFLQSASDYVKEYRDAVNLGLITSDQAEIAHNSAFYNNKEVVRDYAKKFDESPVKNIGVLTELDKSFTDIGIPWESVKSGYITYPKNMDVFASAGEYVYTKYVDDYWSIKSFLERPDTEKKYCILPLRVLRNKGNPDERKAIEMVAKKYGKTYDTLVAGQEAWYEARNIKVSK